MTDAIIRNAVPYRMRSPSDIFLDNSLAVLEAGLASSGLDVSIEDMANIEFFKAITDKTISEKVRTLIIENKTRTEEYLGLQLKQEEHLKSQMHKKNMEFAERLKSENIPLFGEKTFFGDAWANSKELYGIIKEQSPETMIVAGGPHASVWREKIFENSGADFFVIGPGGETLSQLIRIRKESQDKKAAMKNIIRQAESGNIKNLMYLDDDSKIRFSGLADICINPVYFPTYNGIKKDGKLFAIEDGKSNLHVAVDSLGCFWNNCVPCCHKHNIPYYNERYPESYAEEIRHFTDQGIGFFRKGGSGAKMTHQIACANQMLIGGIDIRYASFMRAEPFAKERFNKIVDAYKILIESGLMSVGMGGESGSAEVNRLMKKGVTPDDVKYTAEAIRKAGDNLGNKIDLTLYMIYPSAIAQGMKHERILSENLEFIKCINPTSVVVSPEAAFYGSELYDNMCKYGVNVGSDFDKTMPLFEYTAFLPKEYWKKLEYSIGGLSFDELLHHTALLSDEIRKAGILTDCTDEQVVFARGAGFDSAEGLSRFYLEAVADIVSCNYTFIEESCRKFNQASRKIASANIIRSR